MTTQPNAGGLPRDRVAVRLQWYRRTATPLGAMSALGYVLRAA